jgi:hypothetical protein
VECASSRANLAQSVVDKIHAWLSRNRVERRTAGTDSCFSKAVAVNRFLTRLMTWRKWSTYITFGYASSDKGRLPAVCGTVSGMASMLICWMEFCCEIWWGKLKFKVKEMSRSERKNDVELSGFSVYFLWFAWWIYVWFSSRILDDFNLKISTWGCQASTKKLQQTSPLNHLNKASPSAPNCNLNSHQQIHITMLITIPKSNAESWLV